VHAGKVVVWEAGEGGGFVRGCKNEYSESAEAGIRRQERKVTTPLQFTRMFLPANLLASSFVKRMFAA
jgi:hypothetical protein